MIDHKICRIKFKFSVSAWRCRCCRLCRRAVASCSTTLQLRRWRRALQTSSKLSELGRPTFWPNAEQFHGICWLSDDRWRVDWLVTGDVSIDRWHVDWQVMCWLTGDVDDVLIDWWQVMCQLAGNKWGVDWQVMCWLTCDVSIYRWCVNWQVTSEVLIGRWCVDWQVT